MPRQHAYPVTQAVFIQLVDQQGQTLAQRQTDIINQRHGCGTGTAIRTVKRNEVRGAFPAPRIDFFKQIVQPAICANDCLETRGFAGDVTDSLNHVE